MTADARQQAEQIVSAHELRVRRLQHEAEYESEATSHDRLVSALAAAIEETQAESALDVLRNSARQHGKVAAAQRLDVARIDRREALSALGVEVDGARPHSGDSAKEDGDE